MHILESILYEAKNNKWSYPKTFELLKRAQVESYKVQFIGMYKAEYSGAFGVWNEGDPIGYVSPVLSKQFSRDGVKNALMNHMSKKTNFVQFLAEIAAAGVSYYKVDMHNRTVTYCNEDETEFHQENVPSWAE